MGIRDNFQKLIDKKTQEIRDLEIQLREAHAYVQALQDSMKLLPKDIPQAAGALDSALRPGSALARTRDLLKKAGVPLHINEILKQLGKSTEKRVRVSVSGTIAGYARKGKVFTRTGPNTFGLLEFGVNGTELASGEDGDDLPANFGSMK